MNALENLLAAGASTEVPGSRNNVIHGGHATVVVCGVGNVLDKHGMTLYACRARGDGIEEHHRAVLELARVTITGTEPLAPSLVP